MEARAELHTAECVIGVAQEILVLAYVLVDELYGLVIVVKQVELSNDIYCFFFKYPAQQRVYILEVIVERLAVDTAVVHYLRDSDY